MSPRHDHPMLSRRAIIRLSAAGIATLAIPAAGSAQARHFAPLAPTKAISQRVFSEPLIAGNVAAMIEVDATDLLDCGAWSHHGPRLARGATAA